MTAGASLPPADEHRGYGPGAGVQRPEPLTDEPMPEEERRLQEDVREWQAENGVVQFQQSDSCELCRARIGHNRDNHQRSINDSIQSEGISRHIRGLDV